MQIPKEAIEKAIEGEWGRTLPIYYTWEYKSSCIDWIDPETGAVLMREQFAEIALDPTFWQALGKALGWFSSFPDGHCQVCGEPMPKGEEMFNYHGYSSDCPKPSKIKRYWGDEAERFVHLILQGKTTEEFWQELLANK